MPDRATIVVADDDNDIRELVAFKLSHAGHEVVEAPDGSSALDAIRQHRPALAVLDVMMPGMSGLDVLHAVREDPEVAGTKIILLTARSADGDVDAGYTSGADDYVIKPFSPKELTHRVAALLRAG